MEIKYEKRKVMLCMIIEYIILFAGHMNSVPLHTSSDELGAVVGAAKLAGADWGNVIAGTAYYGFGYYSFFSPLFMLTDNPYIIYRAIAAVNVLLRVLILPISFYIIKRYLKVKSEKVLYFTVCLMPLLRTYVYGTICNEYPLEFIFWIIILLSCKVVEYCNESKNRFVTYSILLLISALYMLTLHTRALVVLIALVIVFAVYGIGRKKKLFFAMGGLTFAGYFLIKKTITFIQINIWGISDSAIAGGSVPLVEKINFLDPTTWMVQAHMLLGMIGTETILTAGGFILCVVVIIWYIYRLVSKRCVNVNIYCNIILSISILCMGATVVAFLCSGWFGGLYGAWNTDLMKSLYERKALTYVRYWNVYMPPMILCAIAILYHCQSKIADRLVICSLLVLVIVLVGFYYYIIPLIKDYSDSAQPFMPLMRVSWWNSKFDLSFYSTLILFSLGIASIIIIIYLKKKYILAGGILIAFMALQLLNESFYYDDIVESKASSMIDASFELKKRLEKEKYNVENIYLNDENQPLTSNWSIYYVAQFYFNKYLLQIDLPTQLNEQDIIISTGDSKNIETLFPHISKYVLDDNETWYTYMKLNDLEEN